MSTADKGRSLFCVLAGVAAFLMIDRYAGPAREAVTGQGGNAAISFALYFLALIPLARFPRRQLLAAGASLLAVQAFEAADGFGVMRNVYDPLDYAANTLGVGLALAVDWLWGRIAHRRRERRNA